MSKKSNVSHKIIRIIPDKLFYELWKKACDNTDKADYVNSELKNYSNKYDIPIDHYMDMLRTIFEASHISIKDIIKKSGMSRAAVGYKFCIPIRTLENWCNETRPCPGYIKLMMLREFNLMKLDHHIYIESEAPEIKKPVTSENKSTEEIIEPVIDIEYKNDNLYSKKKYDSIKEWESKHLHNQNDDVNVLLEKLKYLDNNISRYNHD